jgi:hypothetical protein
MLDCPAKRSAPLISESSESLFIVRYSFGGFELSLDLKTHLSEESGSRINENSPA